VQIDTEFNGHALLMKDENGETSMVYSEYNYFMNSVGVIRKYLEPP
jgi:hypothetical protein